MMTSLKPLLACAGMCLLLAGCNRDASNGEGVVATDLQPAPTASQTWEPVPRSPASHNDAPAPTEQGDAASVGPGAGGSQPPIQATFPEGSLRARQAPVPDVILAAEMAAADQAADKRRAGMQDPGGPGLQAEARIPRPQTRTVSSANDPDLDPQTVGR